MGIKYISRDSNNNTWKISSSKSRKTGKSFRTEHDAIEYAKRIKSSEVIFVKKDNVWNFHSSSLNEDFSTTIKPLSKKQILKRNESIKLSAPEMIKKLEEPAVELTITQKLSPKVSRKQIANIMIEKSLMISFLSVFILIITIGVIFSVSWLII